MSNTVHGNVVKLAADAELLCCCTVRVQCRTQLILSSSSLGFRFRLLIELFRHTQTSKLFFKWSWASDEMRREKFRGIIRGVPVNCDNSYLDFTRYRVLCVSKPRIYGLASSWVGFMLDGWKLPIFLSNSQHHHITYSQFLKVANLQLGHKYIGARIRSAEHYYHVQLDLRIVIV